MEGGQRKRENVAMTTWIVDTGARNRNVIVLCNLWRGGLWKEGVENRFDVIFFAGEIRGKFSTPRYISSFFPFFFCRIMKIERVSDNCPDYLGSRADISINSLTDLSHGAYKQAADLINPATRPRYLLCRAVRPPHSSR